MELACQLPALRQSFGSLTPAAERGCGTAMSARTLPNSALGHFLARLVRDIQATAPNTAEAPPGPASLTASRRAPAELVPPTPSAAFHRSAAASLATTPCAAPTPSSSGGGGGGGAAAGPPGSGGEGMSRLASAASGVGDGLLQGLSTAGSLRSMVGAAGEGWGRVEVCEAKACPQCGLLMPRLGLTVGCDPPAACLPAMQFSAPKTESPPWPRAFLAPSADLLPRAAARPGAARGAAAAAVDLGLPPHRGPRGHGPLLEQGQPGPAGSGLRARRRPAGRGRRRRRGRGQPASGRRFWRRGRPGERQGRRRRRRQERGPGGAVVGPEHRLPAGRD
jgi:hypothetical protein